MRKQKSETIVLKKGKQEIQLDYAELRKAVLVLRALGRNFGLANTLQWHVFFRLCRCLVRVSTVVCVASNWLDQIETSPSGRGRTR